MKNCVDEKGKPNHILIMHVYPSAQLHANQADEVFYRVGDKSKKMNFEQRTRLMYAKGGRYFEDIQVRDATVDDMEQPEFCWTELIVNAIGHRDYSIAGTDIQIKMFEFPTSLTAGIRNL